MMKINELDKNALNEAAWAFADSYEKIMGLCPPKTFNCAKAIITPVIIKYLEEVEKQKQITDYSRI